jgi:hypothetical protein
MAPKSRKDDFLFDPEDQSVMREIVTQRLREARQRHYSLTLDYAIRAENKNALAHAGLGKSVMDRLSGQLDNQATEAFANLQNAKTEVRVLTEELRKLDG